MMYTVPVSLQPKNNRETMVSVFYFTVVCKTEAGRVPEIVIDNLYLYAMFYSTVTVSVAPLFKRQKVGAGRRVGGRKNMP